MECLYHQHVGGMVWGLGSCVIRAADNLVEEEGSPDYGSHRPRHQGIASMLG